MLKKLKAPPKMQYSFLQAGRVEIILSYTVKAVLLLSVLYAMTLRDYFIIFSAIVAVTASILPVILSKQWRVVLPIELDLIFTSFIAVHFLLGELGGFYQKFWWFDLLLHDFSGVVIGFVGFVWSYTLFYSKKIHAQPWFIFIFTVSLAMAAGTIWEIFEFSMDQLFGFNMQKSGLVDTMWDLIACLLGSVFVGIPGYFYLRFSEGGVVRRIVKKKQEMKAGV